MKKKRTSMFTVLVLLLLTGYMVVTLVGLYGKVSAAENQTEQQRQINRSLSQENDTMRYAVENSSEDEVIADAARRQLGLVYPDETVFVTGGAE